VPPCAIGGAALAVNGHVHKAERPVRAGETLWHNPGALARTSVDLIDHRPAAWILHPDGTLTPEPLPFEADVFDLTGRLVPRREAGPSPPTWRAPSCRSSRRKPRRRSGRSGDGAVLRDEIEAKFRAENTGEDVRAVVRSLLAEAVERRAGR
jgi:hypothetical protein